MEGALVKYMYNSTHTAILQFKFSDIEMVNVHSLTYTSLKDLMPAVMSSTDGPKDSWRGIPMKDPLLQHAAWAYLQPAAVPEVDRSFTEKMKDKCVGLIDCFSDVIFAMFSPVENRNGEDIVH
ncbi:unnamed protein product [Withania somnifera]